MLANPNSKVIGAFVLGFAFVAGALMVNNFKEPPKAHVASVIAAEAPPRVTIAVADRDENGIEDWRDEFVSTETVQLNRATSSYTLPTTLTGQLGINLFEGFIRSRSAGPFGQSQEELIANSLGALTKETAISIYDTKHVSVMKTWNQDDIRNYANAMAGAISRNDVKGLENELIILNEILTKNQPERIGELKTLAGVYQRTRDDSVAIPVPELFVKQHLDLINTYHALYNDIDAMSKTIEDPAIALLRLKRYQDDALGLQLALENMYVSFEPYTSLFSTNDPALMFSVFSPDNQAPQ